MHQQQENRLAELAHEAVAALRDSGMRVSTCESLTGGMIAAALVEIPGASAVFRGGLVTYQTDTKTILASVPEDLIERYDVVSAEVACAMAEGTRNRLDTDIAVSATGLAGPDGGTEERPVGTVYVGVSTAEKCYAIPLRLQGDRGEIRNGAAAEALRAICRECGKR